MPDHTLGNVNIVYGLAVTPDVASKEYVTDHIKYQNVKKF